MSVNIINFHESHLCGFDMQHVIGCTDNDLANETTILFLENYFKTLIVNGEVLGFGGFIPVTEDVAEVSVVLSGKLKNKMIYVHRAVMQAIKNTKYRRLFMRCHEKFYASIIWANMLGFEQEGIEREYLIGEDFIRFSLIKGKVH